MKTSAAPFHRNPSAAGARLAGALYLIIIFCGISAEVVLRGPLVGAADPTQAIAENLTAFRLSLIADLGMILADIALAFVFFELLRHVSAWAAQAALVLRLFQAALITVGLLALALVPRLAMSDQRLALDHALDWHATGYDVGLVFFGLNSLIMVWLLGQSGAVPRWILAGIALSGVIYMAGGVLRLVAPSLVPGFEMAYAVPFLAETSLCLWLLITARV